MTGAKGKPAASRKRRAAAPAEAERSDPVEAEIIRCARTGHIADFSGEAWRADGAVATISADFLTDLWLGILPGVTVHPRGIMVTGLAVTGTIDLNSARIDARLRSPLVGFKAQSCQFPDGIAITGARIETFLLFDCVLGEPSNPPGGMILAAGSAEIIGKFEVSQTIVHGKIDAANCVIDDDCILAMGQFHGPVILNGAEIRGQLTLSHAGFDHEGTSLNAVDATIGSVAAIYRCRFAGNVSFASAKAANFLCMMSRFSGAPTSLTLSRLISDRDVLIERCRFAGPIYAHAVEARDSIIITWCVARSRRSQMAAIHLDSARAGNHLRILRCRSHGPISTFQASVTGNMQLWRLHVLGIDQGAHAMDLRFLRCGRLIAQDCRLDGLFWIENAEVSGDVLLHGSTIAGGIAASNLTAGLVIDLFELALGRRGADGWSIEGFRVKVGGSIQLFSVGCASGITFTYAECVDFRVIASIIGPIDAGSRPTTALWVGDARIGRRLAIVGHTPPGEATLRNHIGGMISLTNTIVGEDLYLDSTDVAPRGDTAALGSAIGLLLVGATVKGVILLGLERGDVATDDRAGIDINGALVLDKAKIGQDVAIAAGASVTGREWTGDAGDSPDTLVRRRKSGVALSLIETRIEGTLEIGRPRISGVVDLRDSSVGTLADGCGRKWREAGVAPGALLIEGFSYRNLDEDEALDAAALVRLRLDWLAMQHPESGATAASFAPQPYDQLAHHFAQQGDERARRQVHIARRELQRRHSGLGWIERSVALLLSWSSRYGYSPGRASFATLLFIAIGAALAWSAQDAFVASSSDTPVAPFSPALYAIDVAVPFLELGQDHGYALNPARLPAFPGRELIVGATIALYRLLGLILISITVLTFTGLLREKD